tara:strand:+ start:386 stop:736 length:351 start_codon:yes stop_codon:yes gene_type:complete
MFTIKDIIGDVVFVSIRDSNQLKDIGLNKDSGHFVVTGHDHMGLWLSHPNLCYVQTEDSNGKPIPDKDRVTENIDGVFLLTWDNIKTIMHYPGREGFDFPSEFDREVGFVINNKGS